MARIVLFPRQIYERPRRHSSNRDELLTAEKQKAESSKAYLTAFRASAANRAPSNVTFAQAELKAENWAKWTVDDLISAGMIGKLMAV
jgi:hypothetical protein